MTLHIKESGSWRTVDQPFANVGGTWKTVREVHIRHGGSWRLVHTTPSSEYNLGSIVYNPIPHGGESGSYYIPTGQGIAYIKVFVEGQPGGGGGGTYTPSYWPCSGSDVYITQTSNVYIGGMGGTAGAITCIHPVEDGDYVSWNAHTDSGSFTGAGGAGYNLNVYPMSSGTSYPSVGAHSASTGGQGFMTQCNIRNSSGTSKAQLWAGGGSGGSPSIINLDSTCTGSGGGVGSGFRGFNVSGSNGATGSSGNSRNSIVANYAESVTTGDYSGTYLGGALGGGNGGNIGSTVANSGNGSAAQNNGFVQIKLFIPDKY